MYPPPAMQSSEIQSLRHCLSITHQGYPSIVISNELCFHFATK
jgi:hypothetical protein